MLAARFISVLLAAGLSALPSLRATAQVSFELIDGGLSRLPIRLTEITDATVEWNDPTGDEGVLPLSDALGLVTRGAWTLGDSAGERNLLSFEPSMLRLTDGRRLTGSLSAQADLPEVLRWQHPVLGGVDVPLEQIDRLVLPRATVGAGSVEFLPPADRSDVVLLRNGDRLKGFVVDLGRDAVIEVDGREVVVPMEAVHQVALANPRERWSGPMVWLLDGSVLGADEIRFEDGRFILIEDAATLTEADATGPGQSITLRPDHVSAVSFDTRRLVPLASLVAEEGAGGRDGVFGAAPIEVSGGSRIEVGLPASARRLTLTSELPLRSRAWGRCELVLSADGVALARIPLSAADPVDEVNLDIAGAQTLEIVLEPGEFGRVQTAIEIRAALVAVD
ncbi:MAG: hypothetical protein AAFR76_14075 [Planctomycetota bacterium]